MIQSEKGKSFRGTGGDMRRFAPLFVRDRMGGFGKDMKICLTGIQSETRKGLTHAYFPALMSCCGTLEYLSGFLAGHARPCSTQELLDYALKYMPQPDYADDAIRVLHRALRHPIAHRGIASGVWVDNHESRKGRRITWRVHADCRRPAIRILQEKGVLRRDPPWECPYTHRVHISLGRLWRDIFDSALGARGYCAELEANEGLQRKFASCMRRLYPT